MPMKQMVVIGAGPAGLMAAGVAMRRGWRVTIVDPNGLALKKLSITGKGRCNVTNCCDKETLLANIPRNSRFLMGAFSRFDTQAVMDFFTDLGVPLKVERGGRVFPVSDSAKDIAGALRRVVGGAEIVKEKARESLLSETGTISGVRCDARILQADRVVLATGGLSYPATGSTGDGYAMAAALGHTIVSPRPSLVPLESLDRELAALTGLSLKNVGLYLYQSGRLLWKDMGEMLFTHFGLSGPMVLSASAHIGDFSKGACRIVLDLKPALSEQMLDKRLLRDFSENLNRDFKNSLSKLLPSALIPVIVARSGIDPHTKVNEITKKQRDDLCRLLKSFEIPISGPRPVAEAIVTSGGVRVSEINPKTMESKKVPGLFFAGELIDVDGYTGGFNLQIAWSTGYAAGAAADNNEG